MILQISENDKETMICYKYPDTCFNVKMLSYQYRKSHCGDNTVASSSYLHNGISYTGKMTSLYWFRDLVNIDIILR